MSIENTLSQLKKNKDSYDGTFEENLLFVLSLTKKHYPMCDVFLSKKLSKPHEQKPLNEVLTDIYNCTTNAIIYPARIFYSAGQKDEYDSLKASLSGFTIAGTFDPTRSIANIKSYSGFMILDIDKLDIDQLSNIFKKVCSLSFTFSCFISPSGAGLKVIVKVSTDALSHNSTFSSLITYYENELKVKIDKSGSDLSRLCYFSCDKNIYVNEDSAVFIPTIQHQLATSIVGSKENKSKSNAFDKAIKLTEKTYRFIEGERNNFVFLLANNCNRFGISLDEAEIIIKAQYNYNEAEVNATIKGAYERNIAEFAKFARVQTGEQNLDTNEEELEEDYLKSTPNIPTDFFAKLPNILVEGCLAFPDNRKRDVFLTSAISILSGCLPNVSGIYFQERVYPHLYTFIVAPAASGKGVMKNAKRLADKCHQKIVKKSKDAQKKYELEIAAYKERDLSKKKVKSDTENERPIEPQFRLFYIPANCSKARMLEHLQANEGQGVICETEADTMSGSKKQDWGDYSDILRAAFHHEKLSSSRKTGNEYFEIDEPRLAVSLTGTPSQVAKLIESAEDGLFSRFLFYAYKNEIHWNDPSPKNHTIVFNDHFNKLSELVLELNEFLEQSNTVVKLTDEQWSKFNLDFDKMLKDVAIFTSEDAAGIVYRLGLINFRICMIFSAIRKFENGELTEVIFCTDEDFISALMLVKTYLIHSILMFNNLPKQNDSIQFKSGSSKRKFFEALPNIFSRKEAVDIGATFKLSIRTVDTILRSCLDSNLEKINTGKYKKK